ncbi:MAG: glycosyltransferase [Actinomycetota bacterium]
MLALVAARNEAGRVGATVEAIRRLPDVDEVVVVDGASTDGTAEEARAAGARVLLAPRAGGKGGALEGAVARLDPPEVYLLLDADLGPTAAEAGALVEAVVRGRLDLAIGDLPPQPGHGGLGLVKRTAGAAIRTLCGYQASEPLSGQRALWREVMEAVRPLAPGFGVEVGMTVDAVRAGFRVGEVRVNMIHAPTGRDLAGFAHRARQGLDVLGAAGPRLLGRP